MDHRLTHIQPVRRNGSWFLALGVLLMLLGIGIIGLSYQATIFSMVLFGICLMIGGSVQVAHAILARQWSGLFLSLFLGILYIITGFLCVTKPTTAAISVTLWIAAFLFIAGLFKMLAALILRFHQWSWVFLNGVVTFLFGLMIYTSWPLSGLWVISLFIGVDLILAGWSWIILSFSLRKKKDEEKEQNR